MLYVTHDQIEALTLADRIVCMSMGYVQQVGTPLELYDNPANIFVASFIGLPPMNMFDGVVEASKIVCDGFEYPLSERESELLRDYVGKIITLGVRPENVIPDENGYLSASVTLNENLGQNTLVHGTVSGHKMTAKVRDWCNYKKGDQVSFSFDRVHFFDKETTNAIR
jgi:multiple sugar transport system ATP-binding protein